MLLITEWSQPMPTQSSNNLLPLLVIERATTNNTLPPMLVQQGTNAVVTYPMTPEHLITLQWIVIDGEGRYDFTAQGSDSGQVAIFIPPSVIGFSIGLTVHIICTITLQGQPVQEGTLDLTVEVISLTDMPRPELLDVVQQDGSPWLDMRRFWGNARGTLKLPPFIEAGNRLWLEYVGEEHLNPKRLYCVFENYTLTDKDIEKGSLDFEVSRNWLIDNSDYSSVTGAAKVIYSNAEALPPLDPSTSALPANGQEFHRNTNNLRLGNPDLKLNPPSVRQASGKFLNPLHAQQGATIRIAYEMLPTDLICAEWIGTNDEIGSPDLDCINGNDTGILEVHVPPSAVRANFDNMVAVRYIVHRDGKKWNSTDFDLTILPLTDLPSPNLVGSEEGVFDPSAGSCGATVHVKIWPFAFVGQPIWVNLHEQGQALYWLRYGTPLTPQEKDQKFIECYVPPAYLSTLSEGKLLQITCKANFDNQIDESTSLPFPTQEVLSKQAYKVTQKIRLVGSPWEVTASPDNKWLFVGKWYKGGLDIINTDTQGVVANLPTGNTRMITFNRSGELAYVCGESGLHLVDVPTHSIIKKITTNPTFDSAVTPDGKYLYATNFDNHNVYIFKTSDYTLHHTIPGFKRSRGIAIEPSGARAFVANLGANTVSVVDLATNAIAHTLEHGFSQPNGLALSPDGSTLYVANFLSASLTVINTLTLSLITEVSCFKNLYTVIVSSDGKKVYASDPGEGKLVVIDAQSNRVIGKAGGFSKPYGLALLPDQSTLYLADTDQPTRIKLPT